MTTPGPLLWYLTNGRTQQLVTLTDHSQGLLVGPYTFSHERAAWLAAESSIWPPEVSEHIMPLAGPLELFVAELVNGFEGAAIKPDCFSLDAIPFNLTGGLCAVTEKGAQFADRVLGRPYWVPCITGQGLTNACLEVVRLSTGLMTVH